MADAGSVEELEPGLRLLRAPNPSPMTFTGTNTWVVGDKELAVIDPGPDDPAHLAALLSALGPGEQITHVVVTHAHRDHACLAPELAASTGAEIWAAGGYAARRRPVMAELAREGLVGGGEGVDQSFAPDHVIEDNDVVAGHGWELQAISTPGHIADHLAFAWKDMLFTGDHVMGWASSLVSPPDGDLIAFMASCERLMSRDDRIFLPGHGDPVLAPEARLQWLVDHRRTRDAQIRAALADGPGQTPTDLARRVYSDVDKALLPAAARNVLAHLIAGWEAGNIGAEPKLGQSARFFLKA